MIENKEVHPEVKKFLEKVGKHPISNTKTKKPKKRRKKKNFFFSSPYNVKQEFNRRIYLQEQEMHELEQQKNRDAVIQTNKLRVQKQQAEEKAYNLRETEDILIDYYKKIGRNYYRCPLCKKGDEAILYDLHSNQFLQKVHPKKAEIGQNIVIEFHQFFCPKCAIKFDKISVENRGLLKKILEKLQDNKERFDFQAELFNKINRILNELKMKVYE